MRYCNFPRIQEWRKFLYYIIKFGGFHSDSNWVFEGTDSYYFTKVPNLTYYIDASIHNDNN